MRTVVAITVAIAGVLAGCGSSTGTEPGTGGVSSGAAQAHITQKTLTRLTEIAQQQARVLGDPNVHSAAVVVTTRRRMNTGLGIGYQASQDQRAKVFVVQIVGTFTCTTCSYPPGTDAPTGSAAQDVLSYGSLSGTDFGLTKTPVVMQRMGRVVHLTW